MQKTLLKSTAYYYTKYVLFKACCATLKTHVCHIKYQKNPLEINCESQKQISKASEPHVGHPAGYGCEYYIFKFLLE